MNHQYAILWEFRNKQSIYLLCLRWSEIYRPWKLLLRWCSYGIRSWTRHRCCWSCRNANRCRCLLRGNTCWLCSSLLTLLSSADRCLLLYLSLLRRLLCLRMKIAILFLIRLDQICSKWIKTDQTWLNWISHLSKNVTRVLPGPENSWVCMPPFQENSFLALNLYVNMYLCWNQRKYTRLS